MIDSSMILPPNFMGGRLHNNGEQPAQMHVSVGLFQQTCLFQFAR